MTPDEIDSCCETVILSPEEEKGDQQRRTIFDACREPFRAPWFITIMGTGMASTMLLNFAYPSHWLKICGHVMFGFCSLCLLMTMLHFINTLIRYPDMRSEFTFHPSNAPFMGCLAMGFSSWVIALHSICDGRAPIFFYVLWWISNIASLYTAWVIPFFFMQRSTVKISELSVTLLLPLVSLTVTASCGGNIVPSLPESLKLSTTILCFLLWANAMTVSFIFLTIYTYRLLFYRFPAKGAIFTSFIPIGFLGQGAFAVQLCGVNFYNYTLETQVDDAQVAQLLHWVCVLAALFLESAGFFLTFFAFASVLSYGKHKFHYGFWAMTFPLGTMHHATRVTGELTGWTTFSVIASIYGAMSVLWTILCLCGSTYDVYTWFFPPNSERN
ncbi:unnamed protein product [Cyberlindnera jadinii]|uniref:C4-dicarboxylate transporter/malic acid transport protein n=2 Tax=Opisthokonta TaxID=33154 RepID=A0A0H5CH04_CYBJN|nr:unnamed protein product [Cyberlindnera jadinii]